MNYSKSGFQECHCNHFSGRLLQELIPFSLISMLLFFTGDSLAAGNISDSMPEVIPDEIIADWESQDSIETVEYATAIDNIISVLPSRVSDNIQPGDTKDAYIAACHQRRVYRISQYTDELKQILFARHYNLGDMNSFHRLEDLEPDSFMTNMGSFGQVPTVNKGQDFAPGGALCLLTLENYYSNYVEILTDSIGVIRDPCVSFDGTKVVFAWSKDNNGYRIYEMDIADPSTVRQLTTDPGALTVSDYEPCYLPTGDILFNSSRCFGYSNNSNNITSNLFLMDGEGNYLRRITFDQLSNFSPSVKSDGAVFYSRWEANDRNTATCFPLMSMNPDGARQNEYFGNQSRWPVAIYHARQIPYTTKIMAILGVQSSSYAGDLAIIDPDISRNAPDAIELIAPIRESDTSRVLDGMPQFQNPWPFDEEWFLVSWREDTSTTAGKYSIYFMNSSGERELLAWNENQSLSQPMSLIPRDMPLPPVKEANYSESTGEITLYNAYFGTGTGDVVDSGTIKKIRVIALEQRVGPVFGHTGPNPYSMTPVSRWPGTRDAKRILGETPVAIDGSAAFIVPARTPLYLQLIDENGSVINSQRSWMTLQRGELFNCYGCHEDKNAGTQQGKLPLIYQPAPLDTFLDLADGSMHYSEQIQPILDANCIGCHDETHEKELDLRGDSIWTGDLTDDDINNQANRYWCRSYYNLTDPEKGYVNFVPCTSSTGPLMPNTFGSSQSMLITKLREGHNDVVLDSVQMGKLCAWIDLGIPHAGTYTDDMKPEDAEKYRQRLALRTAHEEMEAANMAALAEMGVIDGGRYGSRHECMALRGFSARFIRHCGRFHVILPSEGKVTLVDLAGREVWSVMVDRKTYLKSGSVAVPFSLPSGVYIVSFTGSKGIGRVSMPVY